MGSEGFFVAPFAGSGELLDVGFWEYSRLSGEWLRQCEEFLDSAEQGARKSWPGKLSNVSSVVTAAKGAALTTFYVDGHIATSCVFLSGLIPAVESEVARMFIDSARRMSERVLPAKDARERFAAVSGLRERPLAVVVVWASDAVSDEDFDVVRELGLHLAGAFFRRAISSN